MNVTKKYAKKLLGSQAHEIDYCLKDCENMGWSNTSFCVPGTGDTIYASKKNNRWHFRPVF
jgi:hypothetical protein